MRGDHTGQMRSAASARDDDTEPAIGGFAREIGRLLGRAMRRKNMRFICDAELIEGLDGVSHCFPIGFAPHDNCDQ